MKMILITALFVASPVLFAQEVAVDAHSEMESQSETADGIYGYGGSSDSALQYNDLVGMEVGFLANSKDWYVGGEAMLFLPVLKIGLGGQVMYRYDSRPVFERIEDNHYRQYRETRWVYGLLAQREFMFGFVGPYVRAGYGWTSGEYQGSEKDPGTSRAWILGGGIIVRVAGYTVRAGYQYTPIPNFPDNFISMSFGRRF